MKKSKYKSGEIVFAKWKRETSVMIKLIYYLPNYEWCAEFKNPDTQEIIKDYFDERDFD